MYLVSRTETFAKLFFLVSFTGLFMYVAIAFYSFHTTHRSQLSEHHNHLKGLGKLHANKYIGDLKYILIWTVNNFTNYENEGQAPFIENDCTDLNCYVTHNKTILDGYYTNFDAIVFNLSIQSKWKTNYLPKHRLYHQKYVFYSKLPSQKHPICYDIFDSFFNWTWTYKLDSDIFSPFIEVKDLDGNVVAPGKDVIWTKNVVSLKKDLIDTLEIETDLLTKKAIVWIMNNCKHKSFHKLANFARKLKKALEGCALVFDIYECKHEECSGEGYLEIIRNYYFYLVYEGSATSDYVTNEILKAYDQNVVPIVFGGADYTRFLPDGSYINAKDMPAKKLAALVVSILRDSSKYRDYFQWKTQYTINKVDDRQGLCKLCTLLNNRQRVENFSTYENFRKWWYQGSLSKKCLPKGAYKYSDILSHVNTSRFNF